MGCKLQGDETNVVNESHPSQQRMGSDRILADAIIGIARVETILSLYDMHKYHLHVCEIIHSAI